MAVSRRHFQKIADAIAEAYRLADSYRDNGPEFQQYATARCDAISGLSQALADVCASENPNFDRARFLAACQPSKE